MSNLIITRYSDKAIDVFGNTENYKTQLIDLGSFIKVFSKPHIFQNYSYS